jgi:hypothetical protein
MDPLRVVMLAQFYPPLIGGEERHVRNLSQALAARGHSVAVATIQQHGLQAFELDGAVRVHRLRGTVQRIGMLFKRVRTALCAAVPGPGTDGSNRAAGVGRKGRRRGPPQLATAIVLATQTAARPWARRHPARSQPRLRTKERDARRPSLHGARLRCASGHYGTIKGGLTTAANWISGALERNVVDKFLPVSRAIATDLERKPGFGKPIAAVLVMPTILRAIHGEVPRFSAVLANTLPLR